jgi:GNAT superfamily N-acetyltransferase
MARYETRPFTADCLDDAARLRSADHRRHRAAMPALDAAFENANTVRSELAVLLGRERTSGVLVAAGREAVAYVFGAPRSDPRWGSNVFVENVGFGGGDPEAIREGYAAAARHWVEAGFANHSVVVNAADSVQIEAWFSLSFGKQHVHALRERADAHYRPHPRGGLLIRPKEMRDMPALAELGRVVPRHVRTSPTFSFIEVPSYEEALAEAAEDFDDERFTELVAEHHGRVVGSAVGCSLELSQMTTKLMRPKNAGFLGHAAVLPEGRGLGVGRALGEAVICWSRDQGYAWTAADWRSANLEADRTWRSLGFTPSFYRLHRLIG